MPASEIAALLTALRAGQVSLDAVATSFRQRTWLSSRSTRVQSGTLSDPGACVPGSMDEITAAYDRGDLTREQYRVLAHAVAEAINAAGRRERGG
jgi:hypothetical protein